MLIRVRFGRRNSIAFWVIVDKSVCHRGVCYIVLQMWWCFNFPPLLCLESLGRMGDKIPKRLRPSITNKDDSQLCLKLRNQRFQKLKSLCIHLFNGHSTTCDSRSYLIYVYEAEKTADPESKNYCVGASTTRWTLEGCLTRLIFVKVYIYNFCTKISEINLSAVIQSSEQIQCIEHSIAYL